MSKFQEGASPRTVAVDTAFVEEHAPWMFKLTQRILADPQLAEDAVQEAFLAAHRKGGAFEGRSSVRTWLYRIAVNAALAIRQKHPPGEVEDIDALQPDFDSNACRVESPLSELRSTQEVVDDAELADFVRRCVDSLPEPYRVCLKLRDLDEHSVADVAKMLDISEANVKVRTHRARSAMKKLMEPLLRGRPIAEILEGPVPVELSPSILRRAKGAMMARLPLMITCEQFEAFIADYLDDVLPERQRRLFEFHIRTCRECREYLAAYERSRSITRASMTTLDEVPADLLSAIVSALDGAR